MIADLENLQGGEEEEKDIDWSKEEYAKPLFEFNINLRGAISQIDPFFRLRVYYFVIKWLTSTLIALSEKKGWTVLDIISQKHNVELEAKYKNKELNCTLMVEGFRYGQIKVNNMELK